MKRSVPIALAALFLFSACEDSSDVQPLPTPPETTEPAPVTVTESLQATPAPAEEPIPLGQLSKSVMPTRYRIALTIAPEKSRFEGEVEIDVTLAEPRAVIFLHGRALTVTEADAVLPDGRRIKASYEQVDRSGVASLSFAEALPAGPATLDLVYYGDFGTQLNGLYKVMDGAEAYIFTQFEPIAARLAFPSFDEPAFKVPFDLQVIAPDALAAVTNTPEIHRESLGNGMIRRIFQTTKPLPTYLVAFAVGPLDIVEASPIPASALRAEPIPLRGVTVKGKGERIRYALERTQDIVLILEDYFGVAYPYEKLDIIAAADFAAGAMENAGAIVYRETLILLDESASLQQRRDFALVHAHELAHHWFGNLVTPAWWDDIWLNEAFASWMGEKATAMWLPEGEYDRKTIVDSMQTMDTDALPSARSIRQAIESNGDIYNAFDRITYDKGAGILSMFESYLGKDAFREGVRLHMKRFLHGVATTRDFLESLAQGSGRPEVTAAFESFLTQSGVPLISMTAACEGDPRLEISQSPYAGMNTPPPNRLWQVPVCVRATGNTTATGCALIESASESLAMPEACTAAIFPNAGGQGYYRFALEPSAWRALTVDTTALTPGERIALLHSLRAGFRAGSVETDLFLDALTRHAADPVWDVVDVSLTFLNELHDTLLEADSRTAFYRRMAELLVAPYRSLGLTAKPDEPSAETLMRTRIVDFLVRTVEAPEVIDALAPYGQTLIASGGSDAGRLAPDLVETALWAFAKKGGAANGRTMIAALLASRDQQFRRNVIVALQGADDPAFEEERHDLILSQSIRTNEARRLLENLLENQERRSASWAWLKVNFDSYGKRLSEAGRGGLAGYMRRSCDTAMRADVASFFEPKRSQLPGLERELANTLDAIDRCLTLREARGVAVAEWFKNAQTPGSN